MKFDIIYSIIIKKLGVVHISILLKIQDDFVKLSNANKKIAKFIINSPNKFATLSGNELSKQIDVSPASITRFCTLFGFANFFDLKIALSKEITTLESFLDTTNQDDLAKQILNHTSLALSETYKNISSDSMQKAASLLNNANRILCMGIGASDLVAQDLTQKLLRLEKNVTSFTDPDLRKVALLQFEPTDVFVGVSYSGEKEETCVLAELAKKRNIKIISITKNDENRLANLADVPLKVIAYEKMYRSSAVSSRIAQLYIVDVLFYTYGFYYQEKHFEKFRRTYEVVNQNK